MKHRVRLDLPLENEADAMELVAVAKELSVGASSINEGELNEEIAFVDYELCGHDDKTRCKPVERLEFRKVTRHGS